MSLERVDMLSKSIVHSSGEECTLPRNRATKSANWVADATLGVAWEQIQKKHYPYVYWVNHRDKLISLSHPADLVQIPGDFRFNVSNEFVISLNFRIVL